jgi:GDP-4-dehydro-6-deoxy-D-mannose reductase
MDQMTIENCSIISAKESLANVGRNDHQAGFLPSIILPEIYRGKSGKVFYPEYTQAEGHAKFREEDTLHPVSPYAVARVSQEMLSKVYAKGYGLDIVMTRSFNHIGPGQKEIFVISSFAKRLVEMKKEGASSPKLITGDISLIRDFVDVRDVVRAYDGLLKKGRKGEIYNICTGVGHSLKELIQQMISILDMEVLTETDENLIRPNDNKVIIGCNEKIKRDIGWAPEISVRRSLEDAIHFWNQQ